MVNATSAMKNRFAKKISLEFKPPLYNSTKYVVNKYGQPIPIIKEDRCSWSMKAARIEVDHEKGHLKIITDIRWITCSVIIDIKTNSLVGIKRLPAKKFNVYDY